LSAKKKKSRARHRGYKTLAMTQALVAVSPGQCFNVRQTLRAFRLVCKKNETHPSHPERAPVLLALTDQRLEHAKSTENQPDCGKPPAYPQDRMCRTTAFSASRFFVQHRFSVDTMLVQRHRERVNR
jgi:hypothetical protein